MLYISYYILYILWVILLDISKYAWPRYGTFLLLWSVTYVQTRLWKSPAFIVIIPHTWNSSRHPNTKKMFMNIVPFIRSFSRWDKVYIHNRICDLSIALMQKYIGPMIVVGKWKSYAEDGCIMLSPHHTIASQVAYIKRISVKSHKHSRLRQVLA